MTRTFIAKQAVRERVPLVCGLTGPQSAGKTKSALRLADGMRSVEGGKTHLIDTESGRAKHYADEHDFMHVPFEAPHSPADYIAAIEYCVKEGATIIIIDSTSHEWEGIGGVLDIHNKVSGGDPKKSMKGWAVAKREHGLFVRTLLQLPAHFILCFRAKPKLKIRPGKEPEERGYMAIGGEDLAFELTVNCLLLPGARGVPTWDSKEEGERATIKRPGWSDSLWKNGQPLDEATGAALAKWAAGTKTRSLGELISALDSCNDAATLGTLRAEARIAGRSASKDERELLKIAGEGAIKRVEALAVKREPEAPESEPAGDAGEKGDGA